MRILFIPADNISANFSRSFYLGKELSKHAQLYRLRWDDHRSAAWSGKKGGAFNTLSCFLSNLFTRISIEPSAEYGFDVHAPIFLNAFIGRVIGGRSALNYMRKHNKKVLEQLVVKIQPDVIFHADGFYYFPLHRGDIPEFGDLQDDINWSNYSAELRNDEINYYNEQFAYTRANFIVSENARESFTKHVKAKFIPISNGADFESLRAISDDEVASFKNKLGITNNEKIASYIGGQHKYDDQFANRLFDAAQENLPYLKFVIAGDIGKINKPNVISLGMIPVKKANLLYAASDVGLTLKNTAKDQFIYNSAPLKFVQYSAVEKPIVTFPIKWATDQGFRNILTVLDENLDSWISTLKTALKFEWDDICSEQWRPYDWGSIGEKIFMTIKENIQGSGAQ